MIATLLRALDRGASHVTRREVRSELLVGLAVSLLFGCGFLFFERLAVRAFEQHSSRSLGLGLTVLGVCLILGLFLRAVLFALPLDRGWTFRELLCLVRAKRTAAVSMTVGLGSAGLVVVTWPGAGWPLFFAASITFSAALAAVVLYARGQITGAWTGYFLRRPGARLRFSLLRARALQRRLRFHSALIWLCFFSIDLFVLLALGFLLARPVHPLVDPAELARSLPAAALSSFLVLALFEACGAVTRAWMRAALASIVSR